MINGKPERDTSHFGGVAIKRSSRPGMNPASLAPDHPGGNLKHDAVTLRLAKKFLRFCHASAAKHFSLARAVLNFPSACASPANKSGASPANTLIPSLARHRCAGHARGDELAFDPFEGVSAGRAQDLEVLDMMVLVAHSMLETAKSFLEGQLLPGVAIEIEAERVESFVTEGVRRGDAPSGLTVIAMTVAPGDPPKR